MRQGKSVLVMPPQYESRLTNLGKPNPMEGWSFVMYRSRNQHKFSAYLIWLVLFTATAVGVGTLRSYLWAAIPVGLIYEFIKFDKFSYHQL